MERDRECFKRIPSIVDVAPCRELGFLGHLGNSYSGSRKEIHLALGLHDDLLYARDHRIAVIRHYRNAAAQAHGIAVARVGVLQLRRGVQRLCR